MPLPRRADILRDKFQFPKRQEGPVYSLMERPPFERGTHTAALAIEQLQLDLRLELADQPADRGL